MRMEKRFVIICFVAICLFFVCCANDEKMIEFEILDKAKERIVIPEEIYEDLSLPTEIEIDSNKVVIRYNTNDEVLGSDGLIHPYSESDGEVEISIDMQCGKANLNYIVNAKVLSMKKICEKAKESVIIPSLVDDDLILPSNIGNVRCKWESSNINLISKEGVVAFVSENKDVKLSCTFLYRTDDDSYKITEEYNVIVKPWNASKRFDLVEKMIDIPSSTVSDILLPREFNYNVICNWTTSDEEVINKVGNVNRTDSEKIVTLTAKLSCNDTGENKELTFEVKVLKAIVVEGEMNFYKHILVNRAKDLDLSQSTGLKLNSSTNRIELDDEALTGVYESNIYNTLDFYRIVGSFSCITSEKATAELEYSIKVDGTWSKYLSYGQFGLGRLNVYYNQTDKDAMIDTDMIVPLNNKVGTAFKYRITLRRDSLTVSSPALSLIGTTIFMNDYNYSVDTSNLPDSVDWDVPKLNQNIVPKIGNVICSATTTTMLLKYAGYDFSDKGYEYEHEFMAKMVADTGHNNPTYGNWSYNMMAAGGFGANAYVGKYYSWDEIRYHLANYGPLGASIGGNFGRYTTQGHLIVLRGYRIENGKTTVICNDPNIDEVYYEVSLETFLNCMGSVVYIMEFDKEIINFK